MPESTAIAWTDHTWSPWIGCTEISPGCDHCYARALDRRLRYGLRKGEGPEGAPHWGADRPRYRTKSWDQPLRWNASAERAGLRRRIFPSMCDPFDNEVPAQWRVDLFDIILRTPHLTWMLLTKRIGNVAGMLPITVNPFDSVYPNVWLGATIVSQQEADRDIPKLLATPAANRFVSYEPALGPVDFTRLMVPERNPRHDGGWVLAHNALTGRYASSPYSESTGPALSWVIVGGESDQPGMRARPFDLQWARDTVRQCREAGTACFVKQVGSNARWDGIGEAPHCQVQDHAGITGPGKWRLNTNDRAGANPAEWPEDLRVQETPAC